MNGLQFTSSLISSLAWPLVAVILAFAFRKALTQLLGRIKSYKGPGGEFTFGDKLADAENSVDEAAKSVLFETAEPQQTTEPGPSQLAREADTNPSFVVIRSWEYLLWDLNGLASAKLPPDRRRSSSTGVSALLRDLLRFDVVNPEFVTAATELRDLRDKVAHGRHNPTPGEAAAYAESAEMLRLAIAMIKVRTAAASSPD